MQLNIGPGEEILLRLDKNDIRKSQIHKLLPNNIKQIHLLINIFRSIC